MPEYELRTIKDVQRGEMVRQRWLEWYHQSPRLCQSDVVRALDRFLKNAGLEIKKEEKIDE